MKVNTSIKPLAVALVALVCLSPLAPSPARAQSFDVSKIKTIPSYAAEMSDKQFEETTKQIEENPKGDRYLQFTARVPKKWVRIGERMDDDTGNLVDKDETEDTQLSRRLLGRIVKYYGVENFEASSRFEIQALELDHEITARNWFLSHILSNGYTLQGLKEVNNRRVEALYVLVEKSIPYVVRTAAIINGPRMVLISYYCPEGEWKKERAMQERVINSFTFGTPENTRLEIERTYAFLDLLRFDYPASWRLIAPNISSIEGMNAKLLNTNDSNMLLGEINIRVVSTESETSLPQEVGYLKEDIRKIGLEVGDLIETPSKYNFKPHVGFARVEVYQAKADSKRIQDHEYWLAIMSEDRFYYIVSMVTPSRDADFYNWARNTEAFQIVIESMRP